jgi:hypothetical protein
MAVFGFYFVFLTVFSALGGVFGYAAEGYYQGIGTFVTMTIFMIALWAAWVLSVRIAERLWPGQPSA